MPFTPRNCAKVRRQQAIKASDPKCCNISFANVIPPAPVRKSASSLLRRAERNAGSWSIFHAVLPVHRIHTHLLLAKRHSKVAPLGEIDALVLRSARKVERRQRHDAVEIRINSRLSKSPNRKDMMSPLR